MKRTFGLNSEISVRLLAGIALLAVISTGVSFVAFQSTRGDVAILIEDVDSLRVALSEATDDLSQAKEDQADMTTALDTLESNAAVLPRLAVADFEALAEFLFNQLSSDAGIRRDEALNEIWELKRLYESRMISQNSFINQLSPLQVKMLVNSVDALSYCLDAIEGSHDSGTESAWKSTLSRIRGSLSSMQEESQYDADLIAVLQDQLDLVKLHIQAVLMLHVRDAAVSVARSEEYDFVLDSASVVQVTQSTAVPDITEEMKGFLE